MTDKALFQPYTLGSLTLANRIVMAPLTRNRAGTGLVPSELATTYYAQRASAGLLITEATQVSAQAQGYQDTPGLYTQAQIDGWRKVTDAVHANGGRIFVQLWHVGRISHVDLQPGGAAPVAPSDIRADTKTFVNNGFFDVSEPRALEIEEIQGIVDDFRQAAAKEIGAERTGIRISPVSPVNGISSSDPQGQYDYIVDQLDTLGIVYLHVVEGATGGSRDVAPFDYDSLRRRFKNTYLGNNGYDLELATAQLNEGKAHLFAFGRPFIANPDLVERLKTGAPLAALDPATLYGGGARGYTDYPALAEASAQ
ncbi:alkene reductase [Microbulbifer sp.]|uniref:alkene reductase n=1 Tax=Microbulbifer sp. TaxID=1908541 RepID=UPI003F2C0C1C